MFYLKNNLVSSYTQQTIWDTLFLYISFHDLCFSMVGSQNNIDCGKVDSKDTPKE